MPTDIYFAGENLFVTVVEEPGDVAEAFASAQGVPFRLTRQDYGGEVFINPAFVAFWSASKPVREPEDLQEFPQPTARREAVTDLWGNPVHRKPRR